MKNLTQRQLYYLQLLTWLALAITLLCYASHLESENRVKEYPADQIADELQLREMERYHASEGRENMIFIE